MNSSQFSPALFLYECEQLGAILRNDHFLLKSGKHASDYLAKDALQPHTLLTHRLCMELVRRIGLRGEIDFVIAPAVAGISLAQMLAHVCSTMLDRQIHFVYTEKHVDDDGNETQCIKRPSFIPYISGRTGIVFEDVLTTGGSMTSVATEVRAHGGDITVGVALFNRGGVNGKEIGVPRLEALILPEHLKTLDAGNEGFKTFNSGRDTCPMCAADMPFNMKYGHAAAELARQNREREKQIPPLNE